MIEHIAEGGDGNIAALPFLVGIRASVHGIERPFEHLLIILDIIAHQINLAQNLFKVIKFDLLQPTQRKNEGGETFVTKVRHGDGIVVKTGQRVDPRKVRRILLIFIFGKELHEEIKIGNGILSSDTSELIDGRGNAPVGCTVQFLFDRAAGETGSGGNEHEGSARGYVLRGNVLPIESVLGVEFESFYFLNASVGGPILEGGHVAGGIFVGGNVGFERGDCIM
mmetsp:Transcript_9275/g.16150  ORF Transcript_9275/g.16150 Transcript_9275/m.16150 type:complete len:224 (-) Transcript_9275:186-857(-)